MLVKVTEEDITQGCKNNSDHCPIAIAISRAKNREYRVGKWVIGQPIGKMN